jgi:hypothetical protein
MKKNLKAVLCASVLGLATMAPAQLVINEANDNAGVEFVEMLVITSGDYQNYTLLDSSGSGNVGQGGISLTGSGFTTLSAGAIITFFRTGGAEDLTYNPGGGDHTLAFTSTSVSTGTYGVTIDSGADIAVTDDALWIGQGGSYGIFPLVTAAPGGYTNVANFKFGLAAGSPNSGYTTADIDLTSLNAFANGGTFAAASDYSAGSGAGTPGADNGGANATYISGLRGGNPGPTLSNRTNAPALPTTADALTFTIDAVDANGIGTVNLFYSVETDATVTGPFTSTPLALSSGSTYTGTPAALTGLATGSVVFFYYEATDTLSASSALGSAAVPFRTYVTNSRPSAGDVVINEILITPKTSAPESQPDTDWIELRNTAAGARDLSFFAFSDNSASSFTIPYGTTIPANGHIILAQDKALFDSYAPWNTATSFGPYVFGLGSSGDSAELFDDAGTLYDIVTWTNVAPWSGAANTGRSAELINAAADNSLASNWSSSAYKNVLASAGAVNFAVSSAPNAVGNSAVISLAQGTTAAATVVGTAEDNQTDPNTLSVSDNAPVGMTITYTLTGGTPTTPANLTATVSASGSLAASTYTVTATILDPEINTDTLTFDVTVTTDVSDWMQIEE